MTTACNVRSKFCRTPISHADHALLYAEHQRLGRPMGHIAYDWIAPRLQQAADSERAPITSLTKPEFTEGDIRTRPSVMIRLTFNEWSVLRLTAARLDNTPMEVLAYSWMHPHLLELHGGIEANFDRNRTGETVS